MAPQSRLRPPGARRVLARSSGDRRPESSTPRSSMISPFDRRCNGRAPVSRFSFSDRSGSCGARLGLVAACRRARRSYARPRRRGALGVLDHLLHLGLVDLEPPSILICCSFRRPGGPSPRPLMILVRVDVEQRPRSAASRCEPAGGCRRAGTCRASCCRAAIFSTCSGRTCTSTEGWLSSAVV